MHPNAQLIEKFYAAFQARDGAAMSACYHPQIVFTDPAFGRLEGQQPGAMWRMLCGRAKDLKVTVSNVQANDQTGSAHWEAWYAFGKTGRRVHNIIEAAFVFREGLIVAHTDTFEFWRWSRMALGVPGMLLGWSPILQARVRAEARQGLEVFMQKEAGK